MVVIGTITGRLKNGQSLSLCMLAYGDKPSRYTGKAATFTIKLPDYVKQQSVNLKSNSFIRVDFAI